MNYKNINKQYKYYIVKVEIMRIKNQKPNEKQREVIIKELESRKKNISRERKQENKKRGSTPVLARHASLLVGKPVQPYR